MKYLNADLVSHKLRYLENAARKRKDTKVANGIAMCAAFVEGTPGEDVAPVVHAHWDKSRWYNTTNTATCSCCKRAAYFPYYHGVIDNYRFCPHCGAKMDEEVE